ncbi:MAG: hypothetical protein D3924_04875 [Candidatus Electrothrix sp. AR4]|nr:hypothetical protein [Candidatus Electrothrix sp. AR4]
MIEFARFLVPFFAPFPLGVFCVFLAFFCVLLRLQKTAILTLLVGLGIFIVFGYGLITRQQLYTLERQYKPLNVASIAEQEQQQIRFVVVLGSSHVTDPGVPESGQLGAASLYRLVEGIRIQRQLPRSRLVLSGGANQDLQANAVVAGRVAESLGVDRGRVLIEDRPRDTFEEVKLLQPMLRDKPFVLVTSAAHMIRSMKLFQESGMRPIAAPTDFILKDNKQLASSDILPTSSNLMISQRVIYAWLGELWGFVKSMTGA